MKQTPLPSEARDDACVKSLPSGGILLTGNGPDGRASIILRPDALSRLFHHFFPENT